MDHRGIPESVEVGGGTVTYDADIITAYFQSLDVKGLTNVSQVMIQKFESFLTRSSRKLRIHYARSVVGNGIDYGSLVLCRFQYCWKGKSTDALSVATISDLVDTA